MTASSSLPLLWTGPHGIHCLVSWLQGCPHFRVIHAHYIMWLWNCFTYPEPTWLVLLECSHGNRCYVGPLLDAESQLFPAPPSHRTLPLGERQPCWTLSVQASSLVLLHWPCWPQETEHSCRMMVETGRSNGEGPSWNSIHRTYTRMYAHTHAHTHTHTHTHTYF